MKQLVLFGGLLLASLSHCFALIDIGVYSPGTYGTDPDGATFEIAISPQSLYPAIPAAAEFNLIVYAPTSEIAGTEAFTVVEDNVTGGSMQWDQSQTYAHTDGNTYFTFTYSGTGINLSLYGEQAFVLALTIGVTNTNADINWSIADESTMLFQDFAIRSSLNLLGVNQLTSFALPAGLLPLDLVLFEAKKESTNSVLLEWETANEVDVSHFEVERSYDGVAYSFLDKLEAKNVNRAYYDLLDNSLTPLPSVYYRLLMVDLDGSSKYSPLRVVQFEEVSKIKVYPNPTAHTIVLTGPPNSVFYVFNSDGSKILEGTTVDSITIIDCSQWSAGIYKISFQNSSNLNVETVQIIKQ